MFNVEEGVRDVFMEKYVLYEEYPTTLLLVSSILCLGSMISRLSRKILLLSSFIKGSVATAVPIYRHSP